MGVFEKLKNALFEEEYVEVEEKPKKAKGIDFFKEKKKNEKPIAKKVVLPEKKEIKPIELNDDDLIDEDFDVEPLTNVLDDNKLEEKKENTSSNDIEYNSDFNDEPEIVKVLEKDDLVYKNDNFDNNSNVDNNYNNLYSYPQSSIEKNAYGMSSNKIVSSEYGGAYEKKEARTHFTPSPIISPIYGILDKNYKKDDVVAKKEIKLTTYTRKNVSLDDVRKKAYGTLSDDFAREFIGEKGDDVLSDNENQSGENTFDSDNDLLVDLNDDKPSVKEVTMGDALEYFNDLGLEYNVDYVDATKKNKDSVKKRSNEENEKKVSSRVSRLEENQDNLLDNNSVDKDSSSDSDDNLFDLIDSMYKDND